MEISSLAHAYSQDELKEKSEAAFTTQNHDVAKMDNSKKEKTAKQDTVSNIMKQYHSAVNLYEAGERSGLISSTSQLGLSVLTMITKRKFDGQLTTTQLLQLIPSLFSLDGVRLFLTVLELREIAGLEPYFTQEELLRIKEADKNNDGVIKGAREVLSLLRKARVVRFDASFIVAIIRVFFSK